MFLDGKKIGLFGGSFDPPHLGHVHFSLQAIKLFNLDKVIWLISPGNPLKSIAPAPIHQNRASSKNYPQPQSDNFESGNRNWRKIFLGNTRLPICEVPKNKICLVNGF